MKTLFLAIVALCSGCAAMDSCSEPTPVPSDKPVRDFISWTLDNA